MSKEKEKINQDLKSDKENLKLLPFNVKNVDERVKLSNELLSSLFKKTKNFDKKYQNEELNKFKDDILEYLNERNQHYLFLINYFQDKMQESKKEYMNQVNAISQNYNSIISSQASINNKIDKISNLELFINKTNDQLITHEIRINNLSSDFIKSTQKYDKIYLDNLELPGYIGKFAKFKNCQVFFENVIRELEKINQYKEKNNLDLKSYKEKLDGIIKTFHLVVKNNNDAQMKYIKQLNDKNFRDCKDMNDLLSNRVHDLRIENSKYSMELVKKNEEMNKEWKKILEIKDNLVNSVNEKLNNFRTIFNSNVNSINNFKKEFEEFKMQITEVINYYKDLKNEANNNINVNLNNNSCNNYTGCYISSALPIDKKNFKNFARKFSKRAKTKNKYLDKKQFLKSISNLYSNKTNEKDNNIYSDYKSNIIKIEKLEEASHTISSKEKEIKKKNLVFIINKEKSNTSLDKNKNNLENQSKRNSYGFREPRSCKNVTKIEINSQNKKIDTDKNNKEQNINSKNQPIENDKQNDNKNEIKNNTINDETKQIIDSSSSIINNLEKEKEKEKIVIKNYGKKNKKLIQQSNKSSQSEDLENNNISNIIIANSNTLNTTNDPNYSIYSTNSICNVNKFILNDNLLEGNDKVIKELASELEQSTNKKDLLASNKKKIEDNFKNICNKISPINLNKNDEPKEDTIKIINENDEIVNNNINSPEKIKGNTISTEKTDEPKVGSSNNFYSIIPNQNEYNSLNKKMEIFDKKLVDLENLLKQKLFEIFSQMDNLQNVFFTLNKKRPYNQKLNNINSSINTNIVNSNFNITGPNENINNNKTISHDDYFIHSHSVKRIAPIIEIDPNNLQFSPSPSRNQNQVMNTRKSKEQKTNKGIRNGYTNFKDIKLFTKSENKENLRTNNTIDSLDLTQFKILGKNSSFAGVNKWINLNKLIKYEQSRTSNISPNFS